MDSNSNVKARYKWLRVTLLTMGFAVVGCSATGGSDHQDTIGTNQAALFELVTDNLGALQLKSCIDEKGADACHRYPNPDACTSLDIRVGKDGSVLGSCQLEGSKKTLRNIAESLPILCNLGAKTARLRCVDIAGEMLLDIDPSGKPDTDIGTTRAQALEADDQATPRTKAVTKGCGVNDVLNAYSRKMNKILANEGLSKNYHPQLSNESNAFKKARAAGVAEIVRLDGSAIFDVMHMPSYVGKLCYAGGRICRCARMANKAMSETLKEVGTACKRDTAWSTALWLESGMACTFIGTKAGKVSAFRTTSSREDLPPDDTEDNTPPDDESNAPPADNETPPGGGGGDGDDGSDVPPGAGGGGGTTCVLSPLVLDLDGDGIHPSSLEQGVNFDLSGRGSVQTGWVKGDDGLLALDRNGNGIIDNGTELFGEAPNLDNALANDGFASLALVDQKTHGGNADGLIDSKDPLFAKLLVWNDRNGDGISQKDELRTLAQAGIKRLMLNHEFNPKAIDSFGNHLGLQGSFIDLNGKRRSMIDVQFAYKGLSLDAHRIR